MKETGKPVDSQFSCAAFRHGFWSLDEEPAVCENCEYYEEGICSKPNENNEK